MAITIACKTEKSVIESSIAPEKKLKKNLPYICNSVDNLNFFTLHFNLKSQCSNLVNYKLY